MAKRHIKNTLRVIEDNYHGKFQIAERITTFEYSRKPARATFSWEWTRVTEIELIAIFKNPRLNNIQDEYSFKLISSFYNDNWKNDRINPEDITNAKTQLDRFAIGKIVILSEKERNKWVYNPNQRNEWGFSADDLRKLLKAYKKADKVRQYGYEERLTDANFHSFCSLLSKHKYDACEEWIAKTYQ